MNTRDNIVDDLITQVAGKDVVPLVRALKNRRNVSEFKLAEKMNLEVNQTRNMLYRLYQSNLVSFVRRKDKKKGWYIYYWTFKPKAMKHLTADIKKKELWVLNDLLQKEADGNYFLCPNKCTRLLFENAFDFSFKCPECGEILGQEDNADKVVSIRRKIAELEKDLLA